MSTLAATAQIPAEASVCAAALLSPDKIPDANLGRKHFVSTVLGSLWSALVNLYSEGSAVEDLDVLSACLARRLREMGIHEVSELDLIELSGVVSTGENIVFYADAVRDEWMAREARLLCERKLDGGKIGVGLVDELIQGLTEISPDRRGNEPKLEDLTSEVLRLSEGTELPGVQTGFKDLDDTIQGLPRGLITILAARPSVGKSTLAIAMALESALRGVSVDYYTLEDSSTGVCRRMLARLSGIPTNAILRGMLVPADKRRVEDASQKLKLLPLRIFERVPPTATQFALEAKRNAIRYNTHAIYIDYVQCLGEPGSGTRNDEVAGISRRIKSLAKDTGAAVVLCSQFRRIRDTEKPGLADLRDSGALEQDAHIVLILHDDDESGATRSLIIGKNKDGPTTSIRLRWVKRIPTFENNSFQGVPNEQCGREAGSIQSDLGSSGSGVWSGAPRARPDRRYEYLQAENYISQFDGGDQSIA